MTLLFEYAGDGTGASGSMQGDKATVVGDVSGVVRIVCNKAVTLPAVVMPGQGFVLYPTGNLKRLSSRLRCTLTNGISTQTVRFSTSCSAGLMTGDRFGGIRVVGYNGRSDGCLNPQPPLFLHAGLAMDQRPNDQPPNYQEEDDQVCTRGGKSKKSTPKKGGMGKNKGATKGSTEGKKGSKYTPYKYKSKLQVDTRADLNSNPDESASGALNMPVIAAVVAAALFVVVVATNCILSYMRRRSVSLELPDLSQNDSGYSRLYHRTASSASMSWEHDYQLLQPLSAQPPHQLASVEYALASPTPVAQAPSGHQHVYETPNHK